MEILILFNNLSYKNRIFLLNQMKSFIKITYNNKQQYDIWSTFKTINLRLVGINESLDYIHKFIHNFLKSIKSVDTTTKCKFNNDFYDLPRPVEGYEIFLENKLIANVGNGPTDMERDLIRQNNNIDYSNYFTQIKEELGIELASLDDFRMINKQYFRGEFRIIDFEKKFLNIPTILLKEKIKSYDNIFLINDKHGILINKLFIFIDNIEFIDYKLQSYQNSINNCLEELSSMINYDIRNNTIANLSKNLSNINFYGNHSLEDRRIHIKKILLNIFKFNEEESHLISYFNCDINTKTIKEFPRLVGLIFYHIIKDQSMAYIIKDFYNKNFTKASSCLVIATNLYDIIFLLTNNITYDNNRDPFGIRPKFKEIIKLIKKYNYSISFELLNNIIYINESILLIIKKNFINSIPKYNNKFIYNNNDLSNEIFIEYDNFLTINNNILWTKFLKRLKGLPIDIDLKKENINNECKISINSYRQGAEFINSNIVELTEFIDNTRIKNNYHAQNKIFAILDNKYLNIR